MSFPTISKKVCMLGMYGVGKTSLVRRFVYNLFEEKYLSTIGVLISQKVIEPETLKAGSPHSLKLILWDLANIERFSATIRNYFRGAAGAIVVIDLTRQQSFDPKHFYLEAFLDLNPDAHVVFAGNKLDLIDDREQAQGALVPLAERYNHPWLLTSALTGEGVEELFVTLGRQLMGTQ